MIAQCIKVDVGDIGSDYVLIPLECSESESLAPRERTRREGSFASFWVDLPFPRTRTITKRSVGPDSRYAVADSANTGSQETKEWRKNFEGDETRPNMTGSFRKDLAR